MAEFGISAFSSSDLTSMLQERMSGLKASSAMKPQETSAAAGVAGAGQEKSFMSMLQNAVGDVNQSIQAADKASRDFVTGKAENLHDVMISMEKADVSLRTLSAVRGKVLEAYQDIMKMPI